MCLDLLDVVEICLPVLDNTGLIGGQQPVVRVGVGNASDGGLVSLHDGFKVEAHAIPQSEFSASRSREQSAALWRPLDHVDRMFNFIQGGMESFGGNGLGGTRHSSGRGRHLRSCQS
jgi:hypothetical protein